MEEFGTEMISEEEPDEMHPLFDHIMETFNGRQVK
jgi:hypothetical protein